MMTQRTVRILVVAFLLVLGIAACGQPADLPETEEQPADVEASETPATEPDDAAGGGSAPTETTTGETATDEATDSSNGASGATFSVPAPSAGDPTMTTLVALNVRTGPGTTNSIVGTLPAGAQARIIGKSADGGWWQIQCPPTVGSECWASAGTQYSSAANVEALDPVAAAPAATSTPAQTDSPSDGTGSNGGTSPSPTQSADGSASPTATVAQEDTQPTPTATQPANASPTATATQAAGASPTATPTATATATATQPVQPTATTGVPIAQFDNDSLQNPAVSVFFRITGDRDFTYSNAVSYPNGDQEDWVEFEFPNDSNTDQPVWITLECNLTGSESAQLRATLWSDENKTTQIAICNDGEKQLTVNNTEVQQLQIHFGIPDDAGVYAEYTVTAIGYR